MMDDFIRPPKKEVKQETKQRPIKEVLIVILIMVFFAIGNFEGYFSKKNFFPKNPQPPERTDILFQHNPHPP